MDHNPKKSLITGINGQDGCYLARFLLNKGYEVTGVIRADKDTDLSGLDYLGIRDKVRLIRLDLLNSDAVKNLLNDSRPEEIYHLAAQSSVGFSFAHPRMTMAFNLSSTLHLLESVRSLSLKTRFYQASTSEMFGHVKDLPVAEDAVLHPVSPYAISKAACHWTTINYREAFGLFSCCGILFNHESVLRKSHFVTKKILSTAIRIKNGSNEKLTLGNIYVKRDWGYAPDYVRAMWLMLQQRRPDDYIIATSDMHSLRSFIEKVFAELDLHWREHVIIDEGLFRPSDIEAICGDPSKAKKQLRWDYRLSFSELIARLVAEEKQYQKYRAAHARGAFAEDER